MVDIFTKRLHSKTPSLPVGFPEEEGRALSSGQYGVLSVVNFVIGPLTEIAKGEGVYFVSEFERGQ